MVKCHWVKQAEYLKHLSDYNNVNTLGNFSKIDEEDIFKYIRTFNPSPEIFKNFCTAFTMLKLHSEGARCRFNTGSIVRNLVCNQEDKFCLIGCPGPNFKDQDPIKGAMVIRNDETREIIPKQKSRLDQNYNSDDISVIILEDEDYYNTTKYLGLYNRIPEPNQIPIHCIDMQAHNSEQYKKFIKIINQRRKEYHMIITHCFCGAGRTSSMIMCCKLYF